MSKKYKIEHENIEIGLTSIEIKELDLQCYGRDFDDAWKNMRKLLVEKNIGYNELDWNENNNY